MIKKVLLGASALLLPFTAFAFPSLSDIESHGIVTVPQLAAIQKKAEAGNVTSQADLGQALINGSIGVLPNYKEALYWLNKAAEKGSPVAYYNLYTLYHEGNGVREDIKQASKYATLAYHGLVKKLDANQYKPEDKPMAQYYLAQLYFWGVPGVVKQDFHEAFQLYLASANKGFAHSIKKVAIMYRFGIGTNQDLQKSFQWTYLLAKLGLTSAKYNIGMCYLNGEGVKKDTDRALNWLHEAATSGYIPAISELISLKRSGVIKTISKTEEQNWLDLFSHATSETRALAFVQMNKV